MRPSLQPRKQSLYPNKEAIETVRNLHGKCNYSTIKSYFFQPKEQSLHPNKEGTETIQNLYGKYNYPTTKSYLIRVLIIISSLMLILYFNSINSISQKDSLPEVVDKYDFQEFINIIQSPKLTQLQKENLFDSSIGTYLQGKGIVLDVTRNRVILSTDIENSKRSPNLELIVSEGYLNNLPRINKGDQIIFLGEISKDSNILNGMTAKLIDGRILSITKFDS